MGVGVRMDVRASVCVYIYIGVCIYDCLVGVGVIAPVRVRVCVRLTASLCLWRQLPQHLCVDVIVSLCGFHCLSLCMCVWLRTKWLVAASARHGSPVLRLDYRLAVGRRTPFEIILARDVRVAQRIGVLGK